MLTPLRDFFGVRNAIIAGFLPIFPTLLLAASRFALSLDQFNQRRTLAWPRAISLLQHRY